MIWVKTDKLPELLPQVWMVFLLPLASVGAWYLFKMKQKEDWWRWLSLGFMLFNMLFFAWLFPLLDATGSVKKLGGMVKDAKMVVAYKRMNDAFVFYHGRPIPVISSAPEIAQIAAQNPDLLVIQLGKNPDLTDSLPSLQLVQDEKDLFSSQHTFIYKKK